MKNIPSFIVIFCNKSEKKDGLFQDNRTMFGGMGWVVVGGTETNYETIKNNKTKETWRPRHTKCAGSSLPLSLSSLDPKETQLCG